MTTPSTSIQVLYTRQSSQRGGTLINADNPNRDIISHIKEFISKANKIDLLGSNSLYGSNYKVSIPKSGAYKSPFYSSELDKFGQPIYTILLKFVLLSDLKEMQYWVDGREKYTMVRKEFTEEIKTQQTIYSQSSMLGVPVTVSVLGAIEGGADDIEQHVLTADKDEWSDLKYMLNVSKSRGLNIGIICMEFLESYHTLDQYLHEKKDGTRFFRKDWLQGIIGLVGYSYLRMFSMGFVHYDVHLNNIMIDVQADNYIANTDSTPLKGRIVFIDFGRVQRIEKDAPYNPIYLKRYNNDDILNLLDTTIWTLERLELTGSSLKTAFKIILNHDIGNNSIFGLYLRTHGNKINDMVMRILEVADMRYQRIDINYKEGKYKSARIMDNEEGIELLNLTRINQLKDIPHKFDFMGVIHCYEGEMCMKVPVPLNKHLGIDCDMILLCQVAIQKDKRSICKKYILDIYNQSIAPAVVMKKLTGNIEQVQQQVQQQVQKSKSPKVQPSPKSPEAANEQKEPKAPKAPRKRSLKPCREGQIRNPKTNRCISESGPRVSERGRRRPQPAIKVLKPCRENQVRNPKTDRCVSKSGKVGKKILEEQANK